MDRAVDGDVRAFEVLVRRHGPLIRMYIMRILGAKSEVDDVVQETFITSWAKLPNLENPAVVRTRRRRGSFVGATRIKTVLECWALLTLAYCLGGRSGCQVLCAAVSALALPR